MSNLALTPPVTHPDVAPLLLPAVVLRNDAEALDAARELAQAARLQAATRDQQRKLPWAQIEQFTRSGLGSISIPREYGGPQVSFVTLAEVFAIISAADPALGQIPQNHFGILHLLQNTATERQKKQLFQSVLDGWRIGNGGPERGTRHTLELKARLTAQGDGYVVSGQKFYSTGALYAQRIPTSVVDEHGVQQLAFVPRDSQGLNVIDDWSGFGQRTTGSGSVVFDNVWVAAQDVVPFQSAFERPTTVGPLAQILHAAIDTGIARAAFEDALHFVRTKTRPWIDATSDKASEDPLTLKSFGHLSVRLHATEALLERAGEYLDRAQADSNAEHVAAASIAVAEVRALSTEISLAAGSTLFELAGSQATLAEHGLDRHWRNARVHTLHDPVRWKYHAVGNYYLNDANPPLRGTI